MSQAQIGDVSVRPPNQIVECVDVLRKVSST